MSKRQDIEGGLSFGASSATVKRQIAKAVDDGLIVSHGEFLGPSPEKTSFLTV